MITAIALATAPAIPPGDFVERPAIIGDVWIEETSPSRFGRTAANNAEPSAFSTYTSKTSSVAQSADEWRAWAKTAELSKRAESSDTKSNVFLLRRLSGLSWSKLSELLGVDRRTLHNWANGSEVRANNAKRIAEAATVLIYADRGSSKLNNEALSTRDVGGKTAFELMVDEEFDQVKTLLGPGVGRSDGLREKEFSYSREDRLMAPLIHPGAEASDTAESTGFIEEPLPQTRRRTVRRI
jgi:transcriptional regulator with XRE-family HTH domain